MIDNKYLQETKEIKQNKIDFLNILEQIKKLRTRVIKYNIRRNDGEVIVNILKNLYLAEEKSLCKLRKILKEIE